MLTAWTGHCLCACQNVQGVQQECSDLMDVCCTLHGHLDVDVSEAGLSKGQCLQSLTCHAAQCPHAASCPKPRSICTDPQDLASHPVCSIAKKAGASQHHNVITLHTAI